MQQGKKDIVLSLLAIVNAVCIIGLIYLLIWNMRMQNSMKFLADQIGANNDDITSLVNHMNEPFNLTELADGFSWQCIDWYGSCGNIIFDNVSGMFVPDGYINRKECEGACADYTLHKLRVLPTITAADLVGNPILNKTD